MQICKNLLEDAVRTRAFPGAVLVAGDENGIFLEETAGRLSLDPDSPEVQPDTIYDVASLTNRVLSDSGNLQIRETRPKVHDAVMLALSAAGGKK